MMKYRMIRIPAALALWVLHSAAFAAQPVGIHQPEPLVAAPGSSVSVAGIAALRPTSQATSSAIALTAPTGFGASWGDWMLGVAGTKTGSSENGSAYLGFGLGNAKEAVGLEAVMNVISGSDDQFQQNSFSFKLHKTFGEDTAVAVGVENSLRMGDSVAPNQTYHYFALSHAFRPLPDMPLVSTIGYGDGRFGDIRPSEDEYDGGGAFAAFSLMPHSRFSVSAEWLRDEVNLGVSFVPIPQWPVTVTAAALDVGQENNDSTAWGFAAGFLF